MNNKTTALTGILGAILFALSSIIGGLLIEDYNEISQYISESYAVDTTFGRIIRFCGYIPSGILITVFSFFGYKFFPKRVLTRIGFYGFGIFYGIGTIMVGIFPCDAGCNRTLIDPTFSQIIHNLMGFLTYSFVPICMILIGLGLKQSGDYSKLSIITIASGIISFCFIALLFSYPNSNYVGLVQRVIEAFFAVWIILVALSIGKIQKIK